MNIQINLKHILRKRYAKLSDDEIHIDNIIHNIMINLADFYPQAPPSGGTPRMRDAIHEVNRVDDEQNDFIYSNGLKISDYL